MIEVKVGDSAQKVPVKMVDSIDFATPETGVTTPTVYYSLDGGAATLLSTPTWSELSATYMPGCYLLTLGAGPTASPGPLLIDVVATGCAHTSLLIDVVANLESDTYNHIQPLQAGTAQAGSTYNNILLATSASAVNDYYIGCLVTIISGTGGGQCRLIADYIGSTRSAVVQDPWVTAPDNTSVYRVESFSGILLADTGMAAAPGGSNNITLAPSAPAVADTYVGHTVFISGGTGIGQARIITAYTNTRIATVSPAWTNVPDTSSIYMVLPVGRVYFNAVATDSIDALAFKQDAIDEIAHGVITHDISDHTTSLTLGWAINLIRKILRNRTVETGTSPDAVVTLHDDDDSVLGHWDWDDSGKERTWTDA